MCTGVFKHLWLYQEVAAACTQPGEQLSEAALKLRHLQINERARGVIQTTLASIKEWQKLDPGTVAFLATGTVQILQPVLPPRMRQWIEEILLATPYTPPTATSSITDTKRAKVVLTSSRKYESASLDQQVCVLSACNPGKENDPILLRRAQLRAIERLFYSTSKWLAPDTPMFKMVLPYLDLKDLCGLYTLNTDVNYALSLPNPNIWQVVSRTFGLGEIFWPEYSRAQACVNYDLLKSMKETFNILKLGATLHQITDVNEQVAKEVLQKFKLDQPLPQDRRVAFNTCTQPVFDCIAKRRGNVQFANFLNQLLMLKLNNTPWRYPITLTLMHAAVGNFGDQDTLRHLCYSAKQNRKNSNISSALQKQAELALTFLAKYGTPPSDFDSLFTSCPWIPEEALSSILRLFIQRGVKATNDDDFDNSLDSLFFYRGSSTLLEILLKEAGAQPDESDIHSLICHHSIHHLTDEMDLNRREKQAQDILKSIDLLKSALNTGEQYYENDYGNPIRQDCFYGMALYGNRALMDALLSLGYKPNNSSTNFNTISVALNDKPKNKWWNNRASPETIKLLLDCGAKPPGNVRELIEKNYPVDDLTRGRLLNLFGFSSNF